eukprot:7388577-Prymnesium_polylepis.3
MSKPSSSSRLVGGSDDAPHADNNAPSHRFATLRRHTCLQPVAHCARAGRVSRLRRVRRRRVGKGRARTAHRGHRDPRCGAPSGGGRRGAPSRLRGGEQPLLARVRPPQEQRGGARAGRAIGLGGRGRQRPPSRALPGCHNRVADGQLGSAGRGDD